jgi:hypothetical protein
MCSLAAADGSVSNFGDYEIDSLMRIQTRLFLTVVFCVMSISAKSAIDFTPRYADSIEDGVPFHRMYFTEGNNRIFYRAPVNWQVSADSSTIHFSPKGLHAARVSFRSVSAEDAAIPFDEKGIERVRAIATSSLPSGFTNVEQQFEVLNPTVLHGWTSFEIGFNGQFYGVESRCSILFINLAPGRQLRILIEAGTADFEKLHKEAYRSLATWREVSP